MLRAGLAIGGYELVEPIGHGGFGAVWVARRAKGPAVALKVLHKEALAATHPAKGPSVLDRFLSEARIMKELRHENLVQIYEVIEDPAQGIAAYAMERLRGAELAQVYRGLDLPALLETFATIADTLTFLHEHGVVHRDLKPQNIFVTDPEIGPPSIKLLDFGAAKQLFASVEAQSTGTGVFVGTVQTMAPEAFDSGDERTTPAMDQWGLGVSLYFSLTDRLPFDSHSLIALIQKIRDTEPARMVPAPRFGRSDFPAELVQLVERCLNKAPSRRFGSMREISERLRAIHGPLERTRFQESLSEAVSRLEFPDISDQTVLRSGGHASDDHITLKPASAIPSGISVDDLRSTDEMQTVPKPKNRIPPADTKPERPDVRDTQKSAPVPAAKQQTKAWTLLLWIVAVALAGVLGWWLRGL